MGKMSVNDKFSIENLKKEKMEIEEISIRISVYRV